MVCREMQSTTASDEHRAGCQKWGELRMKRFWKYGVEYAILEAKDELKKEAIQFGPVLLSPGDRVKYMGDGREHRSFKMAEGFSLEYAGHVYVGDGQFLLFTVPEQPQFQQHGIYYSFLFLEPPHTLCLYNGVGSKEIFLKDVALANEPVVMQSVQLTIFD